MSKDKHSKLDELIKKYNEAIEKNNPIHHQLCKEIAEMNHQMNYGNYSSPQKWWGRWRNKILKGGERK